MKVLIIDDDRTMTLIIRQYVRKLGHEVITASNGKEGIGKFQEENPDLVLMDVMMPVMDGYETAREIRTICETVGWVPIIFLTGLESDESLTKAIDSGGDDYIHKPVSEMVLTAKIRAMERIAAMRIQLIKANEELKLLSIYDGLTEISNRRHFDEMFAIEWQRAMRERNPLTVILMDIDYFKPYNDSYGHLMGDSCLKRVATALNNSLQRKTDMIARYGGEEFVALLANTNSGNAALVAETLRSNVEALNIPHQSSKAAQHVTISLGIASTVPEIGTSQESLLKKADEALYHAKEKGRNRFHQAED